MTYRMDDGTVVKTENATKRWQENTRWDGNCNIRVATGSPLEHQTLYRSRKGRYWIECESNIKGELSHAEWVCNHEAARWLLANGHDLPDDLAALEVEVAE